MTREADVVVVGAGAIGASTAYHLTKLGRKVLVVDRSGPASQTSQMGAAQAMQIWGNEVLSRVAIRGIEMLESFTADTGQPLAVYQTGSIRVAQKPEYIEALMDEVERGKSMGVEVDLISPAEAKRRRHSSNPLRRRQSGTPPGICTSNQASSRKLICAPRNSWGQWLRLAVQ